MNHLDRIIEAHCPWVTNVSDDHIRALAELQRIDRLCQLLKAAAERDVLEKSDSDEEPWERLFDIIFSEQVSRLAHLTAEIFGGFEYYDPDTSYEADCLAFIEAFHEFVEKL